MTDPLGPPIARRSSPPPPPGDHNLATSLESPLAVVADTNVVLDGYYRQPLEASARVGHLAVYWSLPLARDLIKVVYRENVLSQLRIYLGPDRATMSVLFEEIAAGLDEQISELERSFRYADKLDAVDASLLDIVADPGDRPVLRAALAVGAPYILSLDRRHLPHGAKIHGIQCWHPERVSRKGGRV